jgi:hypothetical protein
MGIYWETGNWADPACSAWPEDASVRRSLREDLRLACAEIGILPDGRRDQLAHEIEEGDDLDRHGRRGSRR